MIPEADEPKGWMDVILAMIISIFVIVCCGSCRTIRETEIHTEHVHDTLTYTVTQRDSIYLHDSIYHEVMSVGDTIFITNDRWYTQYRDRWHHDSIYISKTDTITSEVTKVVEKQLTIWQKIKLHTGGFAIIVVMLLIIWITGRKLLNIYIREER